MAKTKRKQQQQQQKQLLVIYSTICLAVVSVLVKVDSVCAANMPLNGSGNMLQQQQQQQQQHQIDNSVQAHNYIMDQEKQSPPDLTAKNPNIFDDYEVDLKEKNFKVDLARNQLDFGNTFQPISVAKRAPAGFLGMHGKKFYDADDNNIDNNNEFNLNFPWKQLQDSDEVITWDEYAKPNVRRYKKAPNAFYGVRGKKFVGMNGIDSNNNNNQWPDFLQKLEEERVRDAILQDFVERLAGGKNGVTNDMAKRAPTGFTGVRGKRPFLDELDASMETLAKRGLGNNAFIGVRGKKDVSHQTFKRSPAGQQSSPGRNGKRQRFVDFNNKFVAVRGKKSSYDDMSTLNNAISNSGPRLDTVSLSYDKRTPKGFLGVRGKRPLTTDEI